MRSADTAQDFRRPNGPWELELEMDFSPTLWIMSSASYDTYVSKFTETSVEMTTQNQRGDFL